MRQILKILLAIGFCVAVSAAPASAVDHSNLDDDRPLDMEDAYPIDEDEWAVEGGLGFNHRHTEPDQGFFTLQALYGAFPNTHVTLTTSFATDPRTIDEEDKSGDIQVAALYNFNQETLWAPAFGFKLGVNLPTGVGSSGVDYELKGIVTKGVGGGLTLHFNAIWNLLNGVPFGVRDDTYKFVLGGSWAPGVPMDTRTVLLANLFTEEAAVPGTKNTTGAGFGTRYQLNQQVVLDAGVTTEFSGPVDRSRLLVNVGASYGF